MKKDNKEVFCIGEYREEHDNDKLEAVNAELRTENQTLRESLAYQEKSSENWMNNYLHEAEKVQELERTNIDDLNKNFAYVTKLQTRITALRSALAIECYCEKLHPDTGGKCQMCTHLTADDKLAGGQGE